MYRQYRTGDQTLVREINLASVLRFLQASSIELSRAKLAQAIGLNKTTVSSLVEELIERGLLHETGFDTSGTGRPAKLLEVNPQAGRIIGMELGVDFISVILANFEGHIVWRKLQEIDPTEQQPVLLEIAFNLIDEAQAINEADGLRLLGIGLTLPGMVDVTNGVLLFSPNLQWRDVSLYQVFQKYTNYPFFADNDANAAALGEHFFGIAQQSHHFISLTVGVGIGCGLFLAGNLYRGAGGIAGEIGHTSFITDGNRPCRCGHRGCWETSGNQYALIERVRALIDVGRNSLVSQLMAEQNSRLTLSMIAQAAEAADEVVLEALADTGRAIGRGVANLVNIFNPELVVIGGMMSLVGEHLLPTIQEMVVQYTLQETCQQTKVVLSTFGPTANVMGAVALVVNAILSKPSQVAKLKG